MKCSVVVGFTDCKIASAQQAVAVRPGRTLRLPRLLNGKPVRLIGFNMDTHEELTIQVFLTSAYRSRCISKKGIPRKDFWHELVSKFNPRKMIELPPNIHVPSRVVAVFAELSSAKTGYCLSADPEVEGTTVVLKDFQEVQATVLSIVPGELAYYRSEWGTPKTFHCLLIADSALRDQAMSVIDKLSSQYHKADTQK